jgi:hypothetical protein
MIVYLTEASSAAGMPGNETIIRQGTVDIKHMIIHGQRGDDLAIPRQVWQLLNVKKRVWAVDTTDLTVTLVTPETIPWPEVRA